MDERPVEDAAQLAAELEAARRRIAALEAPGGPSFRDVLVDTMFDGVSVVDADGRHVDVNPALCRMTGFTREELLGTAPPHPYWPPEELESIQAAMTETLAGEGRTHPLTFRRKSGARFPVLVTPTALRDETGAVVSAFAVVKDMTELRHAEESAAESERAFRLTFDQSPVGAVMAGLDFRFLRVNEAFCAMTGYAAHELEHMSFPDITHPDDVEADKAGVRRLMAGEIESYAREKRYVRKDGGVRWGDLLVRCVRDATGEPLFNLAVVVDITERMEAVQRTADLAAEVRAERDRLAALVDSIPDEIWFSDAEGRFTLANPAAVAEFGPDAGRGTDVRDLAASLEVLRADGSPRPIEEAPPLRALAGETVRNLEEVVRTPATGELRHRLVSATPVPGPGGAVLGSVSVVRDVTDLRRAAEAFEAERARAQSYLDIADVMLIALDAAGAATLANRKACEVLAREERDVVGRDWFELAVPDEIREPLRDLYLALVRGESRAFEQLENPIVTSSGEQRLIAWHNTPVTDESGVVTGVLRSGRDITVQREAEQALCDSEERYRLLVNNAYDAVWLHEMSPDRPGRTVDVNERACELLGYTRAELLALDVTAIDVPEQQLRSPDVMRRLAATGHHVFETELVRKDGARVPVEISASRLDLRGRPLVLSVARDITERRLAQQALHESEERYREVVERANDGIVIVDGERLLLANAAFARMSGYTEQALPGMAFLDFVKEDERAAIAERVRRRLAGEPQPSTYEIDLAGKDGRVFGVEVSAGPISLQGRTVDLVIMRDISERRRVMAALAELQTMRDTAERVARVGGWKYDFASATVSWSPGTYPLYDVDEGAFEGDYRQIIEARIHPDDRALVAADVARYEHADKPGPLEFRVVHRDGSVHVLHGEGQLERGAEGAPVAIVGFIQDVTEQREADAEIKRLNAELAQQVVSRTEKLDAATRELEALAYSMAHDVRAPLRTIDGFSAILMEEEAGHLSAGSLDNLRRVRKAAQTLAGLMDDLTGLSAVSRHELARERVDLSAVAAEVARDLHAEYAARQVDVDVEPGLEAVADLFLVRHIFHELLDNAWKFTAPRRHAHVRVGAVATDDGGQAFFVRDDGVGFDMAYATHLFGAFQRMHPPGEFEGTGIGLAMVQRLVRRHGGQVWAESAVGEGAAFFFTLPAADDA